MNDLTIPKKENTLPPELQRKVDYKTFDFNPIAQAFIQLQRVTKTDVYPTNLRPSCVHKLIVSTESIKFLDGPNGDKDQYIGLVAFGLHVEYVSKIITTKPTRGLEQYIRGNELKLNTYTAIFPSRSWNNMFLRAARQAFYEYYPNVLEIHFVKKSQAYYDMKYLAIVEWNNDKQVFERKVIEFKEHKYKEGK